MTSLSARHCYSMNMVLLLLASTTFLLPRATSVPEDKFGLELVGRARISAVYDIKAVPPYAYALERGFLRVLDVRDPAAVHEVGSLALEGAPLRMGLRLPYLYLTGDGRPLGVIDISDPVRPRRVTGVPELSGAMGDAFELAGNLAYVVRQEGHAGGSRALRLDVVDVARDPAHPTPLGGVDLGARVMGEYGGIAQSNGLAFVIIERPASVINRSELVIVDATTPSAPRVARTLFLPEGKRYKDIDVRGDLLFLLDSSPQKPNGLAIYRMRADRELELIGEALSPEISLPIDLIAKGNIVYGTFKGGSMLVTFDVSNPVSPKITNAYGQEDRWSAGLGMALVGDRLYVTGDNGPAPIFDISAAKAPRLLGRWDYEGGAVSDVVLDGNLAVLKSAGGDVFFCDISSPSTPKRVGAYHGAPPVRSREWQWNVAVAVSGSKALVAFESIPAQLVDISNPTRPVVQAVFTPRGLVRAIVLAGTHAFLAYRAPADGKTPRAGGPSSSVKRGGIESVDFHDPRILRDVGALELDAAVTDLAQYENRLVAVHMNGSLTVVDIHHPDRPATMGRLAGGESTGDAVLSRPTRVALSADGQLAYVSHIDVASGSGTLTVVDLGDGTTPRVLGQLHLERSGREELPLAVDGSRVAILVGGTDVLIVDVSDPSRPEAIARHALPPSMWAEGLAFRNRTVFVGAGEDGLLIYRLLSGLNGLNDK